MIEAVEADAASFAPFGRFIDLADGDDADLVRTIGEGWSDVYTRTPLVDVNPSLGMTTAPGPPFASTVMERHTNIEEALMPAGTSLLLAVAEPTATDAPHADDVRAFVIRPGTAVVLDRGVWHDACRGLYGPTPYYWLASCTESGSSPWTPIAGGPVDVRTPA